MEGEEFAKRMAAFRSRCLAAGLALTHQRLVIYEELARSESHPTPEILYAAVKERIPSISLATIYKSVRTFAEIGVLREVNILHDSLRLDANLDRHFHLVCTRCKGVTDVPETVVSPIEVREALPGRFRAERFNVEVLGVCAACRREAPDTEV